MARAELTLTRASLADEQDRTRDAYRLFAETAASVVELDPYTSGYLYFQAASAAANAGTSRRWTTSSPKGSAPASRTRPICGR